MPSNLCHFRVKKKPQDLHRREDGGRFPGAYVFTNGKG